MSKLVWDDWEITAQRILKPWSAAVKREEGAASNSSPAERPRACPQNEQVVACMMSK
ncbi:hypothetical protein VU07_01115 [Desulfobulbus sp. F4]|nr:hypothetical protein [Desulfobulbus sp. F4]